MKILVGVKMVPKATDVRFVAGINRIDREEAACEMNALDRHALGHALRLARAHGASVCAFTMGPPQASAVLDEALATGADRAIHLVDMRFAGADTLATARALAQLVAKEQPDLVVLGRLATDGGTAQVAPQLATFAGLPVVADATSLSLRDGRLAATVRDRDAERAVEVTLPAVVSVAPVVEEGDLRAPAGAVHAAVRVPVQVLDADALGGDDAGYGIRGSATYVARIDPMPRHEPAPLLTDAGTAAAKLRSLAATPPPALTAAAAPATSPAGGRALVAVTDAGRGGLHRLAFETVACAGQVAGRLGAPVVAVVLGHPGEEDVDALAASGADRVLVVRSGLLDGATWGATGPLERVQAAAGELSELVRAHDPLAVIGPWTPSGRVYVPQAAARCSAGCTGDVVGLDTSVRPGADMVDLVWLKPAWSGSAMARVVARTPVAMGTLRPCAVAPPPVRSGRRAPVEVIDAGAQGATVALPSVGNGAPDRAVRTAWLEDASAVVCVGPRFEGSVELVVSVAGRLGWAVGATPGAVARGILSPRHLLDTERFALSPWLAVVTGLADPAELAPLAGAATTVTVDPDKDSALHTHADVPVACTPDEVFGALDAAVAGVSAEHRG